MGKLIDVVYSKPDIFKTEKGSVFKGIGKDDTGFKKFGETYFSFVNRNKIKGWKCHSKMTCNIICITGEVKVILCEMSQTHNEITEKIEFILSRNNYGRLSIPPDIWFGIKGQQKENIILNIADIIHEDDEVTTMDIQHPVFQQIEW